MSHATKPAFCVMPDDPCVHIADFDKSFRAMLCLAGAWTSWFDRERWRDVNIAPTCLFCIAEAAERGWT